MFYSIDASAEDGSYGRLLNDEHQHPTVYSKRVEVEGETYIGFFSARDINVGEEITYNYGNSPQYWWRQKTVNSLIE